MAAHTVSVVIVSRHRPDWLARCLLAVRQLDYPSFEIVVVADPMSLGELDLTGAKTVLFDEANISAARNRGVAQSAGDICVFIDDDAVPEPLWLQHHVAALTATGADATVGFVRGRNGISYQSRIDSVDREAETHTEPVTSLAPHVPDIASGRALKLVGTNMAIKRRVLSALGGFDEALTYFLDDSDISIRLSEAGYRSAVAPLAEVHHGFAASIRRRDNRVPLDLTEIGRSSAIFFRRHSQPNLKELFKRLLKRERSRLLRHMNDGNCEPRDVASVLRTAMIGWQVGLDEELAQSAVVFPSGVDFKRFSGLPPGHQVLNSRLVRRKKVVENAAKLVRSGRRVSVFSFSLTPVRHHVRYTKEGVWLQTGGQFGRTDRTTQIFKWCRFAQRLKEESSRVAKIRGI